MKIKNLFAVVAVMFASIIQVGCGTAQQGNCPVGQTFLNGVCSASAFQTGYNNYGVNTGYGTAAGSCASGTSYPGNTYGCQSGYVLQGSSCVCQAALNGGANVTPVNTYANGQNGCQQGYYPFQNSCYTQGPCYTGYVFYTPNGMCYKVQ